MRWCAAAGVVVASVAAFLLLLPRGGAARPTLEEESRSPAAAGRQAAVRRLEWEGDRLRLVRTLRWVGQGPLFGFLHPWCGVNISSWGASGAQVGQPADDDFLLPPDFLAHKAEALVSTALEEVPAGARPVSFRLGRSEVVPAAARRPS